MEAATVSSWTRQGCYFGILNFHYMTSCEDFFHYSYYPTQFFFCHLTHLVAKGCFHVPYGLKGQCCQQLYYAVPWGVYVFGMSCFVFVNYVVIQLGGQNVCFVDVEAMSSIPCFAQDYPHLYLIHTTHSSAAKNPPSHCRGFEHSSLLTATLSALFY